MYRLITVALLVLTMAGHVASQQPVPIIPGAAPLREKELAKDKFQARHAEPKALARAKYEAVRDEFESRDREFLAGRGTLDFLIGSTERLREAELGIAENDAQRLEAYERCWTILRDVERINKARYEAGRIPIQDMSQSTYYRLDAEIQWAEERERQKKK